MNRPHYFVPVSNSRNLSARQAVMATTTSVISPPNTTLVTVPISLAAAPLSNPPISLLEPMKMLFTAETRPFMYSGV